MDQVREWWESYYVIGCPSFVLASKLKLLKANLKHWNANVFGLVAAQKQSLLAGLRELDGVVERHPLSSAKLDRRETLNTTLEKPLFMDEISWMQMSRALWLKEVDKNSKYFHSTDSSHRNSNTISCLHIYGNISMNQAAIREHVVHFL